MNLYYLSEYNTILHLFLEERSRYDNSQDEVYLSTSIYVSLHVLGEATVCATERLSDTIIHTRTQLCSGFEPVYLIMENPTR